PFDPIAIAANYSDNCGGDVTVNLTDTAQTGDDCSWTLVYTYEVVDACGNALTGESITYTGSDQTAPILVSVVQNGQVSCADIPEDRKSVVEGMAVAANCSDNCVGEVNVKAISTAR